MNIRVPDRLAAIILLSLVIPALAACGGNSESYEEEMRPLLFKQAQLGVDFDAFLDPLFEQLFSGGDAITAAQIFTDHKQELQDFHQGFQTLADNWESLSPPPVAEKFHQRVLEMARLRVSSLAALVAAELTGSEFALLEPVGEISTYITGWPTNNPMRSSIFDAVRVKCILCKFGSSLAHITYSGKLGFGQTPIQAKMGSHRKILG